MALISHKTSPHQRKPRWSIRSYAAITTMIVVLTASITIIAAFSSFTLQETKTNRTFIQSVYSRFISESGIEEGVYRILSGKQIPSDEILGVGTGTTTIKVTTVGTQRTVRSEGLRGNIQQNLEIKLTAVTTGVGFHYGAQVGDGGLAMSNNSTISGSVYSNGTITGDAGATITGDAFVAIGTPSTISQSWEIQNTDLSVGTVAGSIATLIDSAGDVGSYDSLALGSDGFARISYYDADGNDLKFVRCTDADCTAKNITAVDTSGDVGWRYTSIAIASDGFARISYYDASKKDLNFVRCTNADCTAKNITAVDTPGDVGQFSSMTLGADGFARISYYSVSGGDLKLVRCTNTDCTAKNTATIDTPGDVGKYTSIALDAIGFAMISYYDDSNHDLKFAHCLNDNCSSSAITTVDPAGDVGSLKTAIAIAPDGFARISYFDDTNDDLKFAQCINTNCTSKIITIVESTGNVGKYNAMKLGSDGFARIAYYGDGDVHFASCSNNSCTAKTISTPDSAGSDIGHYNSLMIASDGFGRISHYDYANKDLRFVRCLDDPCSAANPQIDVAQSFKPGITGTADQIDLYLKKVGNPAGMTLRLIKDSGGSPSSNPADVLATSTINAAALTSAYTWRSVYLIAPPTLTANTLYWLVLDADMNNANYIVWGNDSTAGYTRGSAKKSEDWTLGVWTSIAGDLDFRVYMGGTNHAINAVTVGGDASAHRLNGVNVAGNANSFIFNDGVVAGDIHADSLSDCTVSGNAFYNYAADCIILGSETTPTTAPTDPPSLPLPIAQSTITEWKNDASAGDAITGDYSVTADVSLGPKEITGDLLMDTNNKTLTVTGTLYVHGNIDISNGATIHCASSYGANSCVVMSDGWIHLQNNGIFKGSGTSVSYLMFLTTASGGGHHGSAIDLHNNAAGAIFYAGDGMIYLHNNVSVVELTAYKVHLENNATLIYETGLQNVNFSSGPSGSFDITNWQQAE